MEDMKWISAIWTHWLGKFLIAFIVIVLLSILISAFYFRRAIDLWGLKMNMCTDTITIKEIKHDTTFIVKYVPQVVKQDNNGRVKTMVQSVDQKGGQTAESITNNPPK